ncbi:MAG: multidrug transporter [Bacteroidetes bacterium]|nr:multidrug transporter [Bacteroidota bacterium]
MHTGKHYKFKEVILWTRKDIYLQLLIATIPTVIFEWFNCRWLSLPWLPIALLGTAVAFVVGFKNNASYDRLWEARRIWGGIVNASRSMAVMSRDYINNRHAKVILNEAELLSIHHAIIQRHLAWLTALRYQLREPRIWESIYKEHNQEFKNKWFTVEEQVNKISDAIKPYLSQSEYERVMSSTNKATQILALQSAHLKVLEEQGYLEDFRHIELGKMIAEFYNHQGGSERIKNFPYPRQYATLNLWFVKIFILLIPFGMLHEFEKLGNHMVWLTIPFSALSGWIFTTLEKIGESSESPFEGSANDVPITSISRGIEIDMNEILGLQHNLKPLTPQNNILV